jgi:hypothetical protein
MEPTRTRFCSFNYWLGQIRDKFLHGTGLGDSLGNNAGMDLLPDINCI